MRSSPRVLDDFATVWTTPTGAPARFLYRGRRFVVTARPVFWIDRLPWWRQVSRVPPGRAANALEQPMWHVRAVAADGPDLTFDLAADPDSDQWRVSGVYD
ncbi:MAG: DUF6504 family protein [Propionibacteriaceae bacterium]|jgi:hypothetical protein|nr:DUF6504 family protein [Propionibacteriaceae bacterium]